MQAHPITTQLHYFATERLRSNLETYIIHAAMQTYYTRRCIHLQIMFVKLCPEWNVWYPLVIPCYSLRPLLNDCLNISSSHYGYIRHLMSFGGEEHQSVNNDKAWHECFPQQLNMFVSRSQNPRDDESRVEKFEGSPLILGSFTAPNKNRPGRTLGFLDACHANRACTEQNKWYDQSAK